ncbi:MAG: hypothetical protein WC331_11630 [Candidatus Omnitrophota bacterium]|jgi:hypothetical protein
MKHNIEKRLKALEASPGQCPCCKAMEAFSEEELDARLQTLLSGQDVPDLPEPSPSCPRCQAENQRLGSKSEEELNAELARLREILRAAEGYES